MVDRAGFLGRIFSGPRKAAPVQPVATASAKQATSPFGSFGERGETLGEQIAYFTRRMDDVFNLRDEFAQVALPMHDFITSHADAQKRLSEVNALLAKERSDTKALRAGLGEIRQQSAQRDSDFAAVQSQLRGLEEFAEARASELKATQVANADLTARLEWATRELAIQAGVARDKDLAHRTLSDDATRLEQALADATAHGEELRDRNGGHEAEISRLTLLVEQLQPQLTMAKRKAADLGADLHSATLTISSQEFKVAGEQEARRKAEAAHAESLLTSEGEIARLSNDIESLKTKHAATSRLFEQSRELVAEKTEALRVSDRAAKEAIAEKAAVERRLVALQEEIRHLNTKVDASSRGGDEQRERAVMLANAMAAKDRQIEQLQNKAEAVESQLGEAIARFERERGTLEADNRRLIEENQTEKAERALAQGALHISRASREKLLQQLDHLKRGRGVADAGSDAMDHDRDAVSNVHKFHAAETDDKREQPST